MIDSIGSVTFTIAKTYEILCHLGTQTFDNRKKQVSSWHVSSNPLPRAKKDVGSNSLSKAPQRKFPTTESLLKALPFSAYCCSCILEFDGAAKGNLGPAGASVVLRVNEDPIESELLIQGMEFQPIAEASLPSFISR
ncbi:hypothetical protein Tco_0926562 [Tanacetum coccineum]|uniref:Uncharacterized protein n=1 Tax=Tanacetum coccineum TaxID=301880 RepID=A0ABQ5DAZ3_9ASTR